MAKEIKVALTLDTRNFDRKMAGAKTQMAGFSKQGKVATGSVIGLAARFAPLAAGIVGVTAAFKGLSTSLGVASQFEDVRTTLTNIIGSAEGGAAALEVIKQVAEELPFAFEDLAGAAPALSTISSDIGELEQNMLLAADIAATFGIPFQDAASQLQRSFSAGAGAADIFRERGVLAAAGFEAGVSYSIDETIAKLREFGTEIEGAAQTLNQTFSGATSQAGDAITIFQASIGDAMMPEFTAFLNEMVRIFRENKTEILAFGKAIGESVINAIIGFLRAGATMLDIFTSIGQFATKIGQQIRQNFGEQIRTVANVVIKALGGITEAISFVGLGLGKLISLTGNNEVENFFQGVNDAAQKVRKEGLAAIDDVSEGIGNMIPVTANRDAVDELVNNIRTGASDIRDTTTGLVDGIEGDMRDIDIALTNTAKGVSTNLIKDVIDGIGLFSGSLAQVTIPINLRADTLTGDIVDTDAIVFRNIDEFISEIKRIETETGRAFLNINEGAIAFELLNLRLGNTLITSKDYAAIQKVINDLREEGNISIAESIELLAQLDEAFEDQEGLRSFLETLGQAQVKLSRDLATALMEGKSATESFRDFFKTLVTQLIADALRLAIIQPILSSIFGISFGAGGAVSGLTGGGLLGFLSGKASGGPVLAGQSYLVGERGPEILTMGGSNGMITPNNAIGGGTQVTYNINAVDAPSFQQLVAQDPEFIYSVTRAGARRLPGVA